MPSAPTVKAFSDTAREFCKFIEEDVELESRAYMTACIELLLTLHLRALKLPGTNPEDDTAEIDINQLQWSAIRDRISSKLDKDDYFMIFDPFEEAPSPLLGSLSDGLSDIWRDLKRGLFQFDLGNEHGIANALWTWRFGFETHWGVHHSAHAIEALNSLLFGEHAI